VTPSFGVLALAWSLAAPLSSDPAVSARAKIAVLLLPAAPGDRSTADNLTEVVIARLAARGAADLVGTAEFRRRIDVADDRSVSSCLEQAICVDRIAVSLAVKWIVSGNVGASAPGHYLFSLALRDVERGQIERRVFDTVDGSIELLARRVRRAADELFEAVPGAPPAAAGTIAVAGAPGTDLRPPQPSRRLVGYAAGAGALLAFSGALVLGAVARFEPLSDNRAEAQRQLEQRRTLGGIADLLLIAGGLLALGASYVVITRRD
jgi:hypothetical protein